MLEDYDNAYTELLYSYLSDILNYSNEVASLLKHPTNPTYHYLLAERYFDVNDTINYIKVVDSIPIKFNLDSGMLKYHNPFVSLYAKLNY